MTKYPEIFARLSEDFPDVKWKPGKGAGKKEPYVTARQVMNRLDDVLGPENWWDEYAPHSMSVQCRLTIRLPDGATVTKCDAGGFAGMSDSGDNEKAGYSDAFKRSAVKFGVGRLLYGDGTPDFHEPVSQANGHTPHSKAKELLDWCQSVNAVPRAEAIANDLFAKELLDCTGAQADEIYAAMTKALPVGPEKPAAPEIPAGDQSLFPADRPQTKGQKLAAWCARHNHAGRAQAMAQGQHKTSVELLTDAQADALYAVLVAAKPVADFKPREPQGAGNENGSPVKFGWPKSGSALYAWAKNLEQAFNTSVVKAIDTFARPLGFPQSYKEWDAQQVERGAVFAAKLVKALPGYDGQFDDKVPSAESLKDKLADAAKALSKHHGVADPSFAQVNYICQSHSSALDGFGGEAIDDLAQCDNEALIRATTASVLKDVQDADGFTF